MLESDFCIRAWERAPGAGRRVPDIANTDQGSQFTSDAYLEAVESVGMTVSMDGKGRWMDNRMIERLWRSVKYEDIYLRDIRIRRTVTNVQRLIVPDTFAFVRNDPLNSPVLGVVSKDYTPLQNAEAFGFFDPIVGENAAIYNTAGALGQGEHICLLAKLPGQLRVVGDDDADKYLMLANSHDGKGSVQIKFTSVRVVCQNSLTLAMGGGKSFRLIHTPDVKHRLKAAGRLFEQVRTRYDTMEEALQAMARVQVNASCLT